MKPKLTLSEWSVIARRKARFVVIMRELAGTHLFDVPKQSLSSLHHNPVSEHILAGCPSAQKSPLNWLPHDVSPAPLQLVFSVFTPCLHDPQLNPGELTHSSLLLRNWRPTPSFCEILRQKSPLTLLHWESDEQLVVTSSLQNPEVVGVLRLHARGSVFEVDPHG
jgi:hypothetical protein